MKARKLVKNLVFKKETIANLSNQEMKRAQGGNWTLSFCIVCSGGWTDFVTACVCPETMRASGCVPCNEE